MSNYDFLLDSVSKDAPANLRDLEIKYERDEDLKGVLRSVSSEIEWVGSAYSYLRSEYDTAYCGEIDAEIQFACSGTLATLYEGKIFLSDIEWDRFRCVAKTEILEDTAEISTPKDILGRIPLVYTGMAVLVVHRPFL